MCRPRLQKTLEKKLNHWKKVCRLSDWNIQIRYATKTDEEVDNINLERDLASTVNCSPPEKIALVLINKDYVNHPKNNFVFNIDTIILHELMHIIIWEKVDALAEGVLESKNFKTLEEFICDYYARLIFDISTKVR